MPHRDVCRLVRASALAVLRLQPQSSRRRRALRPALSGPACVRLLAERGIAVQPWQGGTRACPIDTPVRAGRGRIAGFTPPLRDQLRHAGRLERLRGASSTAPPGPPWAARWSAIRHYGSFACRGMTGNAGRPSLHAQARALDIAGFQLADGRIVTVVDGWRGPPDQRRFLRAVAAAACRQFSVVLTPEQRPVPPGPHPRRHRALATL